MLLSLGSLRYGVLPLVWQWRLQLGRGVLKLRLVSYCGSMVLLVAKEWCFLGLALVLWVLIVGRYTDLRQLG